eukprot:3652005-Karenia_brevis.AAC.1
MMDNQSYCVGPISESLAAMQVIKATEVHLALLMTMDEMTVILTLVLMLRTFEDTIQDCLTALAVAATSFAQIIDVPFSHCE